jgi:hypothetical protein
MRLASSVAVLAVLTFSLAGCPGLRIADVQNPTSTYFQQAIAAAQAAIKNGGENNGVNVTVSSAVVSWIDTFDETHDGKSIGAVYVQDIGSTAPYSGSNLYEPSYVPASIRLLPGDVVDLTGPYEEQASVGSATFTAPATLPSFSKPVATFDYEFTPPTPVIIQLSDIDETNYATGRKWEGMLVTLNDITIGPGVNDNDRVTYIMGQGDASVDANAAAISNELYDLGSTDYPTGTHFASVTGIVTWFYSYQIAPRTAADLQQ